jgi:GNAT superfamily N-acetyltransferase/predicted GNAT family acetyltransferase
MAVEIREIAPQKGKDLKTFILLPEKIHAGHANWVNPLVSDDLKYFDSKKNKAFSYCDTILLLACKDGRPVGRAMGIINHRYNEHRNEKTARFGYLETYEDREVFRALLHYVEDWARAKGMAKMVGPYGFSDQDPEGWLIEGFDHRATFATYYNFEWMPRWLEEEGYTKDNDWFVYKLDVPKVIPELYKKNYERHMKRGTYEIVEFKKRKEIRPWIHKVLGLMNETYTAGNIYGYAPLDEQEMDELANRFLPYLDPRFVKVVAKDGEVLSFIVAMPDMSEGIRKARGRLLPFGFIHILRAAKKTKQLDLLLGATKEAYRGKGLDALMGVKVLESASKAGIELMDTHHEMEANVRVRAEMERMGGVIYKKFRAFQKAL